MTTPIPADYDWSQHCWAPGKGGYNPECIAEWRSMTKRLQSAPVADARPDPP